MGRRRKHVIARLENLHGGIKRMAERVLSPKKAKRRKTDDNSTSSTHERDKAASAGMDKIETAQKEPGSRGKENAPTTPKKKPKFHWGCFPLFSTPERATGAPASAEITFSLPPPPSPSPRSQRATVEDVEDDGSVRRFNINSPGIIELLDDDDDDSDSESETDSLFDADSLFDYDFEGSDASDTRPNTPNDASDSRDRKKHCSPTQSDAKAAFDDLQEMMRGESRGKAKGYKPPVFDVFVRHRLEGMRALLSLYTYEGTECYNKWGKSAKHAAIALGRRTRHCARSLCKLARAYIADRTVIPINPYGRWRHSMLMDESVMSDVKDYLQGLGNDINAEKLLTFISTPEFKEKHTIDKNFTIRTAQNYLNYLGYRFEYQKKGQYVDGHDRKDVVAYRDKVFLPAWGALQSRMRTWDVDGVMFLGPYTEGCRIVIWFHDETIFYAHDRRKKTWIYKYAPIKPQPKGEGMSHMVVDFISADFGWLRDHDSGDSARRAIDPGKNKDGYFRNKDILEQATAAMDLCQRLWPEFEHVFIYDNATTHCKRADNAPSARKMPKKTKEWLIDVPVYDEAGEPVLDSKQKPVMRKERMADVAMSETGGRQSLYFGEEEGKRAGLFKGMAQLLVERGYADAPKLRAECLSFKCADPDVGQCCCRRILYNLPDFANVPSLLEKHCEARGFRVLFLPKFHCELNPIEQCWGFAKRVYRFFPMSSRQEDLHRNAAEALESVPLQSIRRFANRSARFMDAYQAGLTGPEAAWASRKFPGHRTVPWDILDRLEQAGLRGGNFFEVVREP